MTDVHMPSAPASDSADARAAPLLRLAGPAAWAYRLRQGGQDGEALLDWRPEPDGRYSLRLTRRNTRLMPDPNNPHVIFWNPSMASFDEAWQRLGIDDGVLAVVGEVLDQGPWCPSQLQRKVDGYW